MGYTNTTIGKPLRWWQAVAIGAGILGFCLAASIGAILFIEAATR